MSKLFQTSFIAKNYVLGRPTYDVSIVKHILNRMKINGKLQLALDVGCGSGQFTQVLAPFVQKVIGFDVSAAQIEEANALNKQKHVSFHVIDGYEFPVEKGSVDLISVAQAYHWFDFATFNKAVDVYLRPQGCLAIIVYGFFEFAHKNAVDFNEKANTIFAEFRSGDKSIGPYWDSRRKFVNDLYANVPFIEYPDKSRFVAYNDVEWDPEKLALYLKSWSAYVAYKEACPEGPDHVEHFLKELHHLATTYKQNTSIFHIRFPLVVFTFIKP